MKTLQILIIVASIVLSVFFYWNFPATVPVHWNISGQADGFSSKAVGAFLLPVILILIYFLFEVLPRIDPRKENYVKFKKAYSGIKTAIMLVLFGIYIVTSLNALGYKIVAVSFWVPFLIGLLFVVIGNYLGDIKNNYFVGIRTPWTLSSEYVWNKTHALGGKLFMVGGVGMMFVGFLPNSWRIFVLLAVIALLVLVPTVYSFILHRSGKKE